MKLHRKVFVAFLLVMAVLYIIFSPFLPAQGVAGRHHHVPSYAVAAALVAAVAFNAASSFSSTVLEQRVLPPERLFELHCTRLC